MPMMEKNGFDYSFNPNASQNALKMNNYFKDNSSPVKGKWSVNSHMFQNNQNAVVDRVKEILLKNSHDTEKIRQIKMLLNIPVDEEEIIKIEEDDDCAYPQILTNTFKKSIEEVKEEYDGEKDKL